eukprot:bmy_09362T0
MEGIKSPRRKALEEDNGKGFLSKTFFAPLCSSPSSPPPLPPSPSSPSSSSRGNGRLLGRSKRRNCLRVQSSKKASSIWRDRVRRARRPLPCPPAAAAAAPASCRRDPEPRPAGVSRRERTRTLTLTHTRAHTHSRPPQPHAPARALPPRPAASRSGAPLLLPRPPLSRFVCPWVSLCGLCVRAAPGCVALSAPTAPPGPGSPFPGAGCTRGPEQAPCNP